jgi:integrase/recombinase XerD
MGPKMAPALHRKRAVPLVRCLPEQEWPERDRLAWQRACQRGGLLDDDGLAAEWRACTQATIASGYGRWLTFLKSRDLLDSLVCPGERVTRERMNAYLAELRASNAFGTIHIRILQLCRMLDVMAPGSLPAWLSRMLAKARAAVQPTRDDRARLVPASTLLELARSLMNRAETSDLSARRRAVIYRDGLMIMILLVSALRVGNLAALQFGHSLDWRGKEWWIMFPPCETKNRRPINMPLPAELTPMIDRYLEVWRPVLLPRPGVQDGRATPDAGFLWLGRYGGAFGPKKVNKRINEVTLRELGRALNPHIFRKLVPTELAIHDPAHIGIAQPMLTHARYDTTQTAYNLGRSIDAARRVQATLAALRQTPSKGRQAISAKEST